MFNHSLFLLPFAYVYFMSRFSILFCTQIICFQTRFYSIYIIFYKQRVLLLMLFLLLLLVFAPPQLILYILILNYYYFYFYSHKGSFAFSLFYLFNGRMSFNKSIPGSVVCKGLHNNHVQCN